MDERSRRLLRVLVAPSRTVVRLPDGRQIHLPPPKANHEGVVLGIWTGFLVAALVPTLQGRRFSTDQWMRAYGSMTPLFSLL